MYAKRITALAAALLLACNAHAQNAHVYSDALRSGERYDRFIVKFRADANLGKLDAVRDRVRQRIAKAPGTFTGNEPMVVREIAAHTYLIRSSVPMQAVAAEAWMRLFAQDSAIRYIEVDLKMEALGAVNDPWFSSQPHLYKTYGMGGQLAWDLTLGQGRSVGIIDSGPAPHPDLDGVVAHGWDFVDNDNSAKVPGCAADTHGTRVAGTIAARTNNGIGVASVAPGVSIVPVRVSPGCYGAPYSSDLVRALDWLSGTDVASLPALANPVDVINLSIGHISSCNASLQAAISRAAARNTIVVVAAGNDAGDAGNRQPANCADVVTVGGIDEDGRRNTFSNTGAVVDIVAPGQIAWPRADDSAIDVSYGTSFAAPMVAGIVALMKSYTTQTLTHAMVEKLLKASAQTLPTPADFSPGTGSAYAPTALAMTSSLNGRKVNGAYVIVPQGPNLERTWNGCLVDGENGNTPWPTFHRWGGSGAPETCGLGNGTVLAANGQAVWDIASVTDSRGITAHTIRNRLNGKCLIRAKNGEDVNASLFLWDANANKTWCGLSDADAFINNGQAAWYFDEKHMPSDAPAPIITAGLKTVRPHYAYMVFATQGTPWLTQFSGTQTWAYRFHPLASIN